LSQEPNMTKIERGTGPEGRGGGCRLRAAAGIAACGAAAVPLAGSLALAGAAAGAVAAVAKVR
jgi:hypothetical protein